MINFSAEKKMTQHPEDYGDPAYRLGVGMMIFLTSAKIWKVEILNEKTI